ncbi:PREDICTED: probable LRR receptor-like serine/threonine-protein kinase At1g34110 [Prunus mume]|uniref:Probable LRR receptor-like serine/threonine-protein kinase At1g34110 n=1 Tax=Prunus mume TaxID=102107 RepID=A0ABM0PSZ4_PRUMU|nr:PREDICTED: probable LRR receptor-like serine/threonine-protein kinase At1g34110 [Prunus mume]
MKHLLQYFLLLFLIPKICFTIIPAVHSLCTKDQQLSLLHLKKSLQFSHDPDSDSYPTKVISWNSSTDCCSWLGVNCSSDGHVVGLDLSSEAINDGIDDSSSLFDLQHLQSLNLADNHFTYGTRIPSAIGKLVNLRYLNLSSCSFYGSIPKSIANLTHLQFLDLSENQIQGKIPHWIWSFNHLDYLNLSCNSLVTLEAPLYDSGVSIVDLHSNQLQGQIPTFIPFGYYLDYSSNHFNSIPSDIGLTPTAFFSLSNNHLHGVNPASICNAESFLMSLDLSNNFLSGIIPPCLTAMRNLRVLNLARNNLTGTISNFQVTEHSLLEILELGGNQLGGQFPKSLGNCTQLQVLNLGNNHITDTFPCLLKNMSTLRVLVLRSNNFYGGIGCPNTYGTWPVLQIIHLAHNNFTGEIPGIFLTTWQVMMAPEDGPLSIVKFQMVTLIAGAPMSIDYSFKDRITVTSKGLEMDLVRILSIFTLIDFSCNNFSGPIPKEMGEFKSLHVLNLSGNSLTGEIPSSFGNMRVLESLDLSQNKLGGHIPPQLAKLTFLSFLNISYNQLVGRIPTSTQFSTFPKDSFTGNKGLWGPPLTVDNKARLSPPPALNGSLPNSGHRGINWDLISVEIGFTVGFGVSVGSLVLCKRWSKWYYRAMYRMVLKVFPQLEERIGIHRRHVHINRRWRR